jgi:hypothetical protein
LEDSLWQDAEGKGLEKCGDVEKWVVWEPCKVECEDRETEQGQRDAVAPLVRVLVREEEEEEAEGQ